MRLLSGAAAVGLLLVLLTWLTIRSAGGAAPGYAATLHAFDDFALAQASLRRDVLLARAGLLRNYDPLTADVDAMNRAVAQLRLHAGEESVESAPIDQLAAMVAQQEALTERFKSGNALLQNSLAYFSLLSTGPSLSGARAPTTGALAAAILHLTFDTSPESVRVVDERLLQAATHAPLSGPDAQAEQALLAHARLLRDVLPPVDATVKALLAVPSGVPLEAISEAVAHRRAMVEATAQRYRWALYATSLLLLLALADLGRRLRSRALALRRRAAFEHVIAENSTRLINSPPSETAARLKLVLGELARSIGFERAYIVLDESPPRVYAWSAPGCAYPSGWPERTLALPARFGIAAPDVVALPNVAAAPHGESREALLAAGVRAWACVPLLRPGRFAGVMAFDGNPRSGERIPPTAGLMRLAGDAVTNALEREFLERDRVRLMARLERARHMQAVGSLASGVAHNFNNIIAAILGYAELAEERLPPGGAPAGHVEEIRRAAERGRDLIDSILAFGRRPDSPARPVPMRPLLAETASLLRASLPQGVDLVIGDIPEDLAALGETVQLQQVVLNLCTNAAQAMAEHIDVAVEQRHLSVPLALSHGVLAPGRYVRVAVSDTGRGFDEKVARQLFEPFFTTRSGGTGLGLATVHEIVANHDGGLNVRSVVGEGSCFEAWLPAAPDGPTPPSASQGALPLGHGETVLVIVTDRARLLGAEETLAALGYEPVGFARPREALAACRAEPARFDAVVIAHGTSLPDTLAIARDLRAIVAHRPIVLATDAAEVRVDELAEAGIAEIVREPLVSGELAATLARCLQWAGGDYQI